MSPKKIFAFVVIYFGLIYSNMLHLQPDSEALSGLLPKIEAAPKTENLLTAIIWIATALVSYISIALFYFIKNTFKILQELMEREVKILNSVSETLAKSVDQQGKILEALAKLSMENQKISMENQAQSVLLNNLVKKSEKIEDDISDICRKLDI